jgi:hypothetical protein
MPVVGRIIRGAAPVLRGGGRIALREWLLLLGFVLVLVAGVFTVALPELSKEPEGAEAGATAAVPAHDSSPKAK